MVKLLMEKELRSNLLTFKFLGSAVLLVTLMTASTLVLALDWHRRMDLYQANVKRAQQELQRATAYADVILRLERQPRLANLINQGVGDRFGTTIALAGRYDAPRVTGGTDGGGLQGFIAVDFAHVVGLILSLVALVLSYDLINGDRAQGTLQLTLASGVSRFEILLGKYLGALASVLVPFAAAVLIWLAILRFQGQGELDGATWARVAVAVVLSVLFGSIFVWMGLLTSALTDRPATSLILGLLIWTLAVVIFPPTAAQVISLSRPLPESPVEEAELQKPDAFLHKEDLLDRVLAARGQFAREALDQFRAAQTLMRLSPFAAYDFATSALAGTDVDRHVARFAAARRTDEALRSWQKRQAERDPQRELVRSNLSVGLDLAGLPEAREPSEPLGRTLRRILPDAALLLALNLLLLIATQAVFRRSEIRL